MSEAAVLADDDAAALGAYCRVLWTWEPTGAVRLVSAGSSLGAFVVTSWNVMAFVAVPAALEPAGGAAIDRTVSLVSLAQALAAGSQLRLDELEPVEAPASPRTTLLHLPPRDGWEPVGEASAAEVNAVVDAGFAELQARSAIFGPRDTDLELRRWWAEEGWSGLTFAVEWTAQRLGMLAGGTVGAAVNGRWQRLATPMGQVFEYAAPGREQVSLARILPPR